MLAFNLELREWPESAFNNSSNLHVHLPTRVTTNHAIFVKSINTHHSEDDIENDIFNSLSTLCIVKRLFSNKSHLPLPVIKITFEDLSISKLCLQKGLAILGHNYTCSPKRIYKIIRCFKCQQFGHISKSCLNSSRCLQCGGCHDSDDDTNTFVCSKPPCSHNCGSSDRADSPYCTKFKKIYQSLNSRLTFYHDMYWFIYYYHPYFKHNEDITVKLL